MLPERAEGVRPAPRPGEAGQRAVPPEDVLHVARRDPRGRTGAEPARTAKLTPGELLADNVAPLRRDPQGGQPEGPKSSSGPTCSTRTTTRWTSYYLVNGTLDGSWEGLPTDVIIANWNGGKAAASLKFFAEPRPPAGHRRLLRRDDLSNFKKWDAAAQGRAGRHRLHVHDLAAQVRPAGGVRQGDVGQAVSAPEQSVPIIFPLPGRSIVTAAGESRCRSSPPPTKSPHPSPSMSPPYRTVPRQWRDPFLVRVAARGLLAGLRNRS